LNRSLVLFCFLVATGARADGVIKVIVKLSPAGSFTAKSEKVKGTVIRSGDSFTSEKLSVSIDSLKTGINLRDEHFWKYLKHPAIQKITLTGLKASGGKGTATLEVNGVKKPVDITYSESDNQVKALIRASAKEFNLPPEKYLGISVLDEVTIEAQVDYANK
jgi:hypothetical protein